MWRLWWCIWGLGGDDGVCGDCGGDDGVKSGLTSFSLNQCKLI